MDKSFTSYAIRITLVRENKLEPPDTKTAKLSIDSSLSNFEQTKLVI